MHQGYNCNTICMQGQKLWAPASIHSAYLQGINLKFVAMAEVLAANGNLMWTQSNAQILSANLTAEVACVVQHWLVMYVALKERSTRHGRLPVSGHMQMNCHLGRKHGDVWQKGNMTKAAIWILVFHVKSWSNIYTCTMGEKKNTNMQRELLRRKFPSITEVFSFIDIFKTSLWNWIYWTATFLRSILVAYVNFLKKKQKQKKPR